MVSGPQVRARLAPDVRAAIAEGAAQKAPPATAVALPGQPLPEADIPAAASTGP